MQRGLVGIRQYEAARRQSSKPKSKRPRDGLKKSRKPNIASGPSETTTLDSTIISQATPTSSTDLLIPCKTISETGNLPGLSSSTRPSRSDIGSDPASMRGITLPNTLALARLRDTPISFRSLLLETDGEAVGE